MLKLIGEVYRVVHRSAPVDTALVLALEIDLGAKGIARAVQGVKPQGIVNGEVVAADGLSEIRLPVVPFGARIFPDIAQDGPYFQGAKPAPLWSNDQPGAAPPVRSGAAWSGNKGARNSQKEQEASRGKSCRGLASD